MLVNSSSIIHDLKASDAEECKNKNLQIQTDMNHNGDKTNTININGLKIFLKF